MKRRDVDSVILFDVTYADGTRSSRRKVARTVVESHHGEAAVKAAIEAQDRDIAAASGRSRAAVQTVVRSRV